MSDRGKGRLHNISFAQQRVRRLQWVSTPSEQVGANDGVTKVASATAYRSSAGPWLTEECLGVTRNVLWARPSAGRARPGYLTIAL